MAGWLDDFLNPQAPADLRGLLGGFGMYTAPGPTRTEARNAEEEQRQAEEARAAAAARLARQMSPDRSGFTAGFPAGPDLYGQASAFQMPQFAADPNAAPPLPGGTAELGPTPVKTVSPEMINAPMPGDRSAPTAYFPPGAQAAADLPIASAPTAGLAAPATQPAEHPLLGIGRHILQRLSDNSNSLIAGGGAMMSGGLGKGFSAMAAASPLDIAYQQHRQANEATALVQQALQQRGVPAAQARAMAIDPAFRKEMMPPGQHVTYTDAYGNQHLATFVPSPGGGQFVGPDGKPIAAGAMSGGGMQSQLPEGPDWFEKLPVEYQTEAKNYALGLNAGTANPRKGMPQMIKDIASKWATEHGLVIDENNLLQRRTMMNNIAKDQQGTTGGQLLFGRTAIHHLAEAAEGLTKLGNVSSGLATPTEYANRIRGMTDEQKGKIDAANTALGKYGAEITKFYVGSGGTHGEREHNVAGLSPYSSPGGMAAVLEQEKKLIPGRLEEIGNHVRDTLGEAAYQKWYINANKSLNTDLARIDNAIDTLRGKKGVASEAPAVAPGMTVGEEKQFKQGTGVWDGTKWVPKK